MYVYIYIYIYVKGEHHVLKKHGLVAAVGGSPFVESKRLHGKGAAHFFWGYTPCRHSRSDFTQDTSYKYYRKHKQVFLQARAGESLFRFSKQLIRHAVSVRMSPSSPASCCRVLGDTLVPEIQFEATMA